MKGGALVISLDLEMRWGILESYNNFEDYKENIIGVEPAVKSIIKTFSKYDIHASWATVGALFCNDIEEFKDYAPKLYPSFNEKRFSSYTYINDIDKKQFFNYKLVDMIVNSTNQELASHTYSHLFVNEYGVTSKDFDNDLKSFDKISIQKYDKKTKSFVFPRNQVSYLDTLKENGYKYFRGNKKEWFVLSNSFIAKLFRFYNLHFGSSKLATTDIELENKLVDIKGTIFLRPYDNDFLTTLRIKKIKKVFKYAKNNNKIVHIWWHPHNFGKNLSKNIEMLDEILKYANSIKLNSLNMAEVGENFEKNTICS